MPLYEYRCSDCGSSLEQWQSFQDSPLTECPSCHGTLRRVIHAAGVVFKGGGWYCTDSRSNPASAPASNSSQHHHESGVTVKSGSSTA